MFMAWIVGGGGLNFWVIYGRDKGGFGCSLVCD